jgi:hypothetical protein
MFVALCAGASLAAQTSRTDRLPREVFDVVPPAAHVRGEPGEMAVRAQPCRALPLDATRRRVVDVAVQEWAFFGFRVVDQTTVVVDSDNGDAALRARGAPQEFRRGGRRRPRLAPEEAARVAATIAGYWAVTPEGSWIVDRQNDEWSGPDGIAARWNAPWSAAFISWVMCEAGLGASDRFQRAIAHHSYIDQAIRARDGRAPRAAYVAYDIGEADISPGDLLCSSRRPAYRSLSERRRQMGVGARSHCDVIVKVNEEGGGIFAIGGNVRGTVSLKRIGASRAGGPHLRPIGAGDETRPFFAHLKLRAAPIEDGALDGTPTMAAFGCDIVRRASVAPAAAPAARC